MYTPLTKDQYSKALQAGFTPAQIVENEQKRKAQDSGFVTGKPADVHKSFLQKVGLVNSSGENALTTGLKDFYQGSVKPLAHVADPFIKVAGSGIRDLESIPALAKGDVAKSTEIASKPLFGQQTLAGSSPIQNLGTAASVGSNLIGLGEEGTLASTAKGQITQAVKEGALQGGVQGVGGYLETNQKHNVGGAVLAGAKGATQGAIFAGSSATLQPLFTGEVTPGSLIKDTKNKVTELKNTFTPEQKTALVRAIKPGKNNVNFTTDLNLATPYIEDTMVKSGKPITDLDSLDSAITDTKKRVWQDYKNIQGPNGKATIDGNIIADQMVSALDKRFVAQNPEKAAAIEQIADTYRHDLTLNEAEEFLQSANNDLHSYYAKNKVGQKVAAADPEKGYVVKEADAIRDQLYGKLNELTGEDAAKIKKTYGALTNIQNEVIGRKNVAARQAPVSLGQQISRISAAGDIVKGINLAKPGESAINIASGVGKVVLGNKMRQLNDSNFLIESAFKNPKALPVESPPVSKTYVPKKSVKIKKKSK